MACLFPYQIQNPLPAGFSTIPVPCGKCYDCKMRLASQWGFRLRYEEKRSTSSYFVTLTYENQFVPLTKKGYMTLDDGSHLRTFFKVLRNKYRYRAINPLTGKMKYYYDKVPPIKYYAVGEYGTNTDRPHYHLILFNTCEKYIIESWPYGYIHIGQVQEASIMYCLKYVMKDGKIPKHKNDDRIPEYKRNSINLGLNYLTDEIIKYHRYNQDKSYVTLEGGFKVALPRYFRNKIWSELELKEINRIISEKMDKVQEKNEKEYFNLTKKTDYYEHNQKGAEYKLKIAFQRAKQNRD